MKFVRKEILYPLLGLLVGVLLATSVRAQGGLLAAFQPFVIDITQRVPAEVSIPLSAPDGTIITTTVPLTIGVQLRVQIDGPQQARVEVQRAGPERVLVATATPVPSGAPAMGDDAFVGSLRWRVLDAEDRGQTIKAADNYSGPKNTSGKFIWVHFVVENVGTEPLNFDSPELVDGSGYRYEVIDDLYRYVPENLQCSWTDNLNARVPKECAVIYEIAADAMYLNLAATNLSSSDRNREEVLIFVLP